MTRPLRSTALVTSIMVTIGRIDDDMQKKLISREMSCWKGMDGWKGREREREISDRGVEDQRRA